MTDQTPPTRGEGLVRLCFRIQASRAQQMYGLLKPRAYPDAAYTFRDLMMDAIDSFLNQPAERWQVPYLPLRVDWEKPYRRASKRYHTRQLQVSPELRAALTTIKETRGWPTLAELLRFILDRYLEREGPMDPAWYPRQRDYDPHYKPLVSTPRPPPLRQVPLISLEEHNHRCRRRWLEKVEARKARRRRPKPIDEGGPR